MLFLGFTEQARQSEAKIKHLIDKLHAKNKAVQSSKEMGAQIHLLTYLLKPSQIMLLGIESDKSLTLFRYPQFGATTVNEIAGYLLKNNVQIMTDEQVEPMSIDQYEQHLDEINYSWYESEDRGVITTQYANPYRIFGNYIDECLTKHLGYRLNDNQLENVHEYSMSREDALTAAKEFKQEIIKEEDVAWPANAKFETILFQTFIHNYRLKTILLADGYIPRLYLEDGSNKGVVQLLNELKKGKFIIEDQANGEYVTVDPSEAIKNLLDVSTVWINQETAMMSHNTKRMPVLNQDELSHLHDLLFNWVNGDNTITKHFVDVYSSKAVMIDENGHTTR